jgi:hypothetical protein
MVNVIWGVEMIVKSFGSRNLGIILTTELRKKIECVNGTLLSN